MSTFNEKRIQESVLDGQDGRESGEARQVGKTLQRGFSRAALMMCAVAAFGTAGSAAFGQEWQRTYGRPSTDERGQWVRQTADKGYIAAGTRFGNDQQQDPDMYVVRTDSTGTMIWDRFIDSMDVYEWGFRVEEANDAGGFLVAGEKLGPLAIYLTMLDPAGGLLWAREYRGTFGASAEQLGTSLEPAPDNGWIVGGRLRNAGGGVDQAPVLHRIDSVGNVIWNYFYVDDRHDGATFADVLDIEKVNNGFVVCGFTAETINGARENLVMRIDNAGNVMWARTYPIDESSGNWARGIDEAPNGDFIVTGRQSTTSVGNSYLMRLNPAGDVLWYRTIDEFQSSDSMEVNADGRILVPGKYIGAASDDAAMLMFDSSGTNVWGWRYGDLALGADGGWAAVQTDDLGYHLVGATRQFGSGGAEVYSVKTNAIGESGCNEVVFAPPIDEKGVEAVAIEIYRGELEDDFAAVALLNNGSIETVVCDSPCSLSLELVSSSCPGGGPATLEVKGGSGGNIAFLYSFSTGTYTIPATKPCAGTTLDLAGPVKFVAVRSGNPATLNLPGVTGVACGLVYMQAIDLVDCCTSNVILFQ